MSPRRIALVLREAPVGLIGGVERFTLSLAGAWRSLGLDAFVVGAVSADQALSTILDKVPVHGLPATKDLASLRALLAGCERVVVQQWDAFTPELVPLLATEQRVQLWLHDHSTNCARSFRHAPPAGEACPRTLHSAMSHAVCARCVRPLVPNHPYLPAALDLPAVLAQRAVQADKALRGAHTLLAPSRSHAHALQQLHTGIAVRVVEPGVAREYCVPVAPALANDAPLRVLHSGNHSSEKGTCDLAAALQLAAPQQATLVLAGRATEQGLLERLRVLAPAIALEVHGPYEPHTLVPIAASCDLAVFPSRLEESYGLAAAECGRLGLELVVSDRGALPERVQHDPAAIVPSGDVAALAERLRLAVTHKRRGQTRRGVHSRARSIEDTALELSRDS
jgi:glycosyltransferase involved in cell wall biosynthesis